MNKLENKNPTDLKANPLKLKYLSDSDLKIKLEKPVLHERKIIALVVEHIAEVDRRKLFLKWGYSSLYQYLTQALHYSESAAFRRIQSARALQQMPEVKEALESGSLNISQISLVQTTVRQQEKLTGEKVSLETKKSIFQEIQNQITPKNQKITQKILDKYLPDADKLEIPVQEKHKADDSVELTLKIPAELYKDLCRIKEIYSHIDPSANWVEVLKLMSRDVLQKRDPLQKKSSHAKQELKPKSKQDLKQKSVDNNQQKPESNLKPQQNLPTPIETPTTRGSYPSNVKRPDGQVQTSMTKNQKPKIDSRVHVKTRKPITASLRRFIFQRDNNQCQFKTNNKTNNKICGSHFQLEIDHIQPVFANGDNNPNNLRTLCKAHNHYRYRQGL